MAKAFSLLLVSYFFIVSLFSLLFQFGASGDKLKMQFPLNNEKLTHFKVYWQDVVGGQNPTAVEVVPSVKNSSTSFGLVRMMDNRLTSQPDLNSTILGRAQGFYASDSQQEVAFLMAMNFVFTQGKYNGSTITIMGRNAIFSGVREMPVIGGSGHFRFARGYVEARTKMFDMQSGDATVEYSCYVLHYR